MSPLLIVSAFRLDLEVYADRYEELLELQAELNEEAERDEEPEEVGA